jgi:hypothetical protein
MEAQFLCFFQAILVTYTGDPVAGSVLNLDHGAPSRLQFLGTYMKLHPDMVYDYLRAMTRAEECLKLARVYIVDVRLPIRRG